MKDEGKKKAQLAKELAELRRRVATLQTAETERRRAEEALREANERLEFILRYSAAVIYTSETGGNYPTTYVSENVKELLGYEARDFIEDPDFWISRIHPEDAEIPFVEVPLIFEKDQHGYEYRLRHSDGSYRWVHDEMRLIRDAEGNPIEIVGVLIDITARKRIEEALRESEEKFRLISEQSMLGIFIIQDDVIKYSNQAMVDIYGYDLEEALAWPPGEFIKTIHPDDRDFVTEQARKKESGDPDQKVHYNFKIITKTGEVREVEIFSSTVLYDGRNADLATMVDVTKRKRAEDALRESEEKFRLISEQSLLGIFIIQDGLIKYTNQAALEIFEYSLEEVLNWSPWEFLKAVHPDDRDFVSDQVRRKQVGDGGQVNRYTSRIISKTGKEKWLEIYAKSVLYGSRYADLVVFSNITARARMEEALRESEEKFRLISEQSMMGVAIFQDDKFIYINQAAADMSEYTIEEIMNWGPNEYTKLVYPDERAFVSERMGIRQRGEEPSLLVGSNRIITKSGKFKWLETYAKNVLYQGRQAYLVIAMDITDRVRMEEELLTRSQELEAFAHTISHDLRTPLTLIDGYAQTAQNAIAEGNPQAGEESLQGIIRATRRMDTFIDALLEYARAGHPEGKAERVEPGAIVTELLEEYAEKIKSTHAQVVVRDDLPPIRVDPIRLHQVLANLLDNALKFKGDNPKPRVDIGFSEKDSQVTLFVRNDGPDIPEELHKSIFEPFKRFSAAGSPGLGIGLSTVKRVVEAWGGAVWVESAPGEGSTFFFTAPAAGAAG